MQATVEANRAIAVGDASIEAFAAQVLACLSRWPELDPEIVNVNGGAVALWATRSGAPVRES